MEVFILTDFEKEVALAGWGFSHSYYIKYIYELDSKRFKRVGFFDKAKEVPCDCFHDMLYHVDSMWALNEEETIATEWWRSLVGLNVFAT